MSETSSLLPLAPSGRGESTETVPTSNASPNAFAPETTAPETTTMNSYGSSRHEALPNINSITFTTSTSTSPGVSAPMSPIRATHTQLHVNHATLSPPPQATIDTSSERRRPSSIAAMAAAEVILHDREVRRDSHIEYSARPAHRQSCAAAIGGMGVGGGVGAGVGNGENGDISLHDVGDARRTPLTSLHRKSMPATSNTPSSVSTLPPMPFSSPRPKPLISMPSLQSIADEKEEEIDKDETSKNTGIYVTDEAIGEESYQNSVESVENTEDFSYAPSHMDTEEAGLRPKNWNEYSTFDILSNIASQIPAVAIASVLNFMVGIPFGASYFPVEWSNSGSNFGSSSNESEQVMVEGEFPLPGKEALGLRMFLFSTMMAQLVFTFKSKFTNGIGLQMVENVPFCLSLARIVIEEQGYGIEALSTLFFLFGMASVIVGAVFYLLGKLELGRVVYFFPSHVLVGCIGGIGAFIISTSIEVSTNRTFHFTAQGVEECMVKHGYLLLPVVAFEIVLRILMRAAEKDGVNRFPLLSPVYYCLITPIFYFGLWLIGMDLSSAESAGFFFPPISSSGSVYNRDLFDIFTVIDATTISWKAVVKALPTIVSLTAFSLIHVPINIPAFAISSNVEPDMNVELIAHGYSNFYSGVFGGLQNYMAYSNSVIYSKSNGKGMLSSLGIVAVTILIFIYGPTMASFVPRCMAGTLLLHVGIDLFIEGVYDSFPDYDLLEYSGIWLITIVMITFGMDAALIAGIIAALSTYAVQSITYQHPIRGAMTATRLRSSAWNRSSDAIEILQNRLSGRQRIYVIQLQGHIFFGNVTTMTDDIKQSLRKKRDNEDEPIVLILDFTHVLGIDSSAAQTIAKLKDSVCKNFDVELVIFVTGSPLGFPCTYDLSQKVGSPNGRHLIDQMEDDDEAPSYPPVTFELGSLKRIPSFNAHVRHGASKTSVIADIPNSQVCHTLDDALVFAEDVLIALQDPHILRQDLNDRTTLTSSMTASVTTLKVAEENSAINFLQTLCPGASAGDIRTLFEMLSREKYNAGEVIWEQGSASNSLKLLVSGSLISSLEDENGATETIYPGSTLGELGLVHGMERLTTVKVLSNSAVLYNLSKEKWDSLTVDNPRLASYIYMIVVRYLAHRVQHVSNHILERRSLPV